MPKALSGKAAIGASPCDPRCTKPRHQLLVSKRVRRNCQRELNLAEQIQVARSRNNSAKSSNARHMSANK
ncbi:hypothetical protein FRC09_000929 [Ceratobasidium sp. 395]|nr:hypothetical protein FRC09_000929 [Ceratobasidium sp. 395]